MLSVLAGRQAGKRFHLGDETTIGRGEEADIPIAATDVSRMHARVVTAADSLHVIEDLGSRNGVRVNGELVTEHALEVGDRITIGAGTVLIFSRQTEEEEALLEARKMESLGRLAGGIAHDFNNLLSVIIGNGDLIRESLASTVAADHPYHECLADLRAASLKARDLVAQLLGFARRGRGREVVTDFGKVVREAHQLVARTFERDVTIEVDADPGLMILGDRTQLFQMVMNLCLNSRDALGGAGTLSLSAKRVSEGAPDRPPSFAGLGSLVVFTVRDTGTGMDSETRERLFEPFFTTKRIGEGTGLGLALVYSIVSSHGGRIWVDSVSGAGTTFTVALPAASSAEQERGGSAEMAALATGAPQPIVEGQRALVLVVDDEELVRRSIGRTLSHLGYDVAFAENGDDGVQRYRELQDQRPLVLLDLIMPVMGGEEALRCLKSLDPTVRVLVMSGYPDDVQIGGLRDAGALGFLEKPFGMDRLHSALNVLRLFPAAVTAEQIVDA